MTFRFASLLICLFFVVFTVSASEFDNYSRTLFASEKPEKVIKTTPSETDRSVLLKELALMHYQVETAQFQQVIRKLITIKRKVSHSNQEVKGVYSLVLARLNYRIGKLDKAIALNSNAIRLLQNAKAFETLELAFCNQGFFYSLKRNGKANTYFQKAELLEKKGFKRYRVLLLSNMSFCELLNGNVNKALFYCQKANSSMLRAKVKSIVDQYRINVLFASISELRGEKELEKYYLSRAKALAIRSRILDNWKQVANSQSVNALEQGDIQSAYLFLKEKDSINEMIPNRETSDFLVQMELDEQLKLEKTQKELVMNRLDSKQRELFYIVVFSVLVSLVLVIVIVQRFAIRITRRLLMKQHLAFASKVSNEEIGSVYQDLVRQIEALVKDKELFQDTQLTLDRLAKKLNTNRTYLSECINLHYRMNYSQWLSGLRIEAAKKYLLDKNYDHWSIEGISQTVGFLSISNFNATFKRETGLTPSQFRKMREEYI